MRRAERRRHVRIRHPGAQRILPGERIQDRRLDQHREALAAGELTWEHATALCQVVAPLDDGVRQEAESRLLARLGDDYGDLLSAQRELQREAFGRHHGTELGTEGDSFFVVFPSAADAVSCCLAAQRNLAGYDWPGGVSLRVRMGLHSGEPARHEDGYIGLDVHRRFSTRESTSPARLVVAATACVALIAVPGLVRAVLDPIETWPNYAKYEERTNRRIPVFRLARETPDGASS